MSRFRIDVTGSEPGRAGQRQAPWPWQGGGTVRPRGPSLLASAGLEPVPNSARRVAARARPVTEGSSWRSTKSASDASPGHEMRARWASRRRRRRRPTPRTYLEVCRYEYIGI